MAVTFDALSRFGAKLSGFQGNSAAPSHLGHYKVMHGYHDQPTADRWMQALMAEVPFEKTKWNGLFTLPQKKYLYGPSQRKSSQIQVLEAYIADFEARMNCKVDSIWCNLFENGKHRIDWHQDQYGTHLCVASFGSPRHVKYRTKNGHQPVSDDVVYHGTMYYMSPEHDKIHEHSVPEDRSIKDPRISLAIFCSRPGGD